MPDGAVHDSRGPAGLLPAVSRQRWTVSATKRAWCSYSLCGQPASVYGAVRVCGAASVYGACRSMVHAVVWCLQCPGKGRQKGGWSYKTEPNWTTVQLLGCGSQKDTDEDEATSIVSADGYFAFPHSAICADLLYQARAPFPVFSDLTKSPISTNVLLY